MNYQEPRIKNQEPWAFDVGLCTFALLTPHGRGAVATLLVRGPRAVASVAEVFRPASGRSFAAEPVGRIVFGRWGNDAAEEVVVCCLDDSRVEIHCHGGLVAAAEISQSLLRLGCEQCGWQESLRDDEPDPIAAAARTALADAPTERAAAVLLDQYHGALRRAVEELLLLVDRADRSAAAALAGWQGRSGLGLHLAAPWHVVLAGRPNVGKSSLINALLGYQRAIVYDMPGTTRDVLSASTAFAGWPVELFDTAGARSATDLVEADGMARARARAASADLVVLIVDASQPWTADDAALLETWPQAMVVLNKCDLAGEPALASHPCRGAARVSALMRAGIDELAANVGRRLVPDPPAPGAPVPFTAEQIGDLDEAARLLAADNFAAVAELFRRRPAWRLGPAGPARR